MCPSPATNTPRNSLDVYLCISAEHMLEYYRGQAKTVLAQASDGRWIRFPANALKPFITDTGIEGRFRLSFDAEQRLKSLLRC